ncbi:MAG TPA: hypoxanthine/guanine phosphoribosyltransferase [Candidatus Thermoplasmatota archaeon]|nr:hypoxanthine/guanine phosphoribosyltransferase [Candidatus Thermoplasmatota archaeon]
MGERLRASLEGAPVVRFGEYDYFVHPLTDGIPEVDPDVLQEVVLDILAVADLRVDRILTAEAMGIPLATALSLETGLPFSVVRKRRYGLPGEIELSQETGYSKGALYVNGLRPGARVLIVDDVVSTGGTLDCLLTGLAKAGVDVVDVVVVFEKGDGRRMLEDKHKRRVKTLLRVAVRDGKVVAEGR